MMQELRRTALKNPWIAKLVSLIQFGLIGCVGLVIDFSITWALKDLLHLNAYFSNTCGFSFAVVVNFILNKIWTFKDQSDQYFKQFRSFLIISLIGLMLNTCFLFVFHEKLALNFYIGKAISTVLVFFWNFFANAFFTFGKKVDT
jgi:putative flippase GtrA